MTSMFESNDPEMIRQTQSIARVLQRRVSEAERRYPELVQLKDAEREADARLAQATSEEERMRLFKEHEKTVWALIDFASSHG